MPRTKNIDWNQYEGLIGTMPDKDLAKVVGCSEAAIGKKRRCKKIPRFSNQNVRVYTPYILEWKEYESNIGELRLSLGLTVSAFCNRFNIYQSDYSGLQNGMLSPFYECGKNKDKIKDCVQSVLDLSGWSFEDLFPRYACKLDNGQELTIDQGRDILLSRNGYTVERNAEFQELLDIMKQKLTKREFECTIRHVFYEETLEDIAEELCLTRERIRQIIAKGLRKLRDPISSEQLRMWIS